MEARDWSESIRKLPVIGWNLFESLIIRSIFESVCERSNAWVAKNQFEIELLVDNNSKVWLFQNNSRTACDLSNSIRKWIKVDSKTAYNLSKLIRKRPGRNQYYELKEYLEENGKRDNDKYKKIIEFTELVKL